jgi:hypothetical protein
VSNSVFGLRTRSGSVRDIIEGAPAGDYLLNAYPGAAAAYSLRKLSSTYTGNIIRVRRSSDNTEQNIGSGLDGNLDTSALTTFCSGTNGFATTWYDQSGNSNNAVQASAAEQPQIVSAGNLLTFNGKAALSFDGTDDFFTPVGGYSITDFYYVINTTDTQYLYPFYSGSTFGFVATIGSGGGSSAGFGTPSLYSNGILRTSTTRGQVYTAQDGYRLNVHQGANTFSWTGGYRFFGYGGYTLQGNVQEIIIYPSNQSSNRTGIETNINTHYNIY